MTNPDESIKRISIYRNNIDASDELTHFLHPLFKRFKRLSARGCENVLGEYFIAVSLTLSPMASIIVHSTNSTSRRRTLNA